MTVDVLIRIGTQLLEVGRLHYEQARQLAAQAGADDAILTKLDGLWAERIARADAAAQPAPSDHGEQ